jgi:hypothetical protein
MESKSGDDRFGAKRMNAIRAGLHRNNSITHVSKTCERCRTLAVDTKFIPLIHGYKQEVPPGLSG